MTFTDIMKAAFNFVFGLELDTRDPTPEEERRYAGAVDGTPTSTLNEEWEALAFPQAHISLGGQVPTHTFSAWR
ncbi:hypothetical protein BD413DRAFT_470046 [Trametes elegans]|nr:hypothetical protein BD413DRAFT_470046 [Trametes elegans]